MPRIYVNNISDKFNLKIIFPNNDAGSRKIVKIIKKSNLKYTPTLNLSEYKTLLTRTKILIGNSSSGIIEAPYYGVSTINLGDRQKGRKSFGEVIDLSGEQKTEILLKLEEVIFENNTNKKLADKKFLKSPSNLITSFLGRLQ